MRMRKTQLAGKMWFVKSFHTPRKSVRSVLKSVNAAFPRHIRPRVLIMLRPWKSFVDLFAKCCSFHPSSSKACSQLYIRIYTILTVKVAPESNDDADVALGKNVFGTFAQTRRPNQASLTRFRNNMTFS